MKILRECWKTEEHKGFGQSEKPNNMFSSNKPIIQIAYGVEDIVTEAENGQKDLILDLFTTIST